MTRQDGVQDLQGVAVRVIEGRAQETERDVGLLLLPVDHFPHRGLRRAWGRRDRKRELFPAPSAERLFHPADDGFSPDVSDHGQDQVVGRGHAPVVSQKVLPPYRPDRVGRPVHRQGVRMLPVERAEKQLEGGLRQVVLLALDLGQDVAA